MILRSLLTTAATALALFSAPVSAQQRMDFSQYTFAKAPLPASAMVDADPAIWVVKDPDTTIYLFGTVHLLKPGLSWFDEAIKAAYDSSDELVIEMIEPDTETIQQATLRLAIDPSGTPLRDKLTPEARAKYEAALTKLGVPAAGFDSFRPWFAGLTLGVLPLAKAGFDPNSGVEKSILGGNTKPVEGLETLDEQLGFFANLPEEDQIAFLNATIDNLDSYTDDIDKLVAAWADGDVDRVATLMNEGIADSPPIVGKVLLADRNARWAKWIEARLKRPGTVFLAVGAGHLAGADSVQEKLKLDGLAATRINY